MSEAPKDRWLRLIPVGLPLACVIFFMLNWYFDTSWWRDLVNFVQSKIVFRVW